MSTITTPRPPLNLFEVVRVPFDENWTTIYDVPDYVIPATGLVPEKTINTAAIISNLLLSNATVLAITADIRVLDPLDVAYTITSGEDIGASGFIKVDLDKHIMMTGDRLQVKSSALASGIAHLSFVLNQREQFTIL